MNWIFRWLKGEATEAVEPDPLTIEERLEIFIHRYPLNIPGKYYINASCTDCDLCRELASDNIRRHEPAGYSYVYKQPTTLEETKAVEEGVAGCPTEGVSNDGDLFDWKKEPIWDWNHYMKNSNEKFLLVNPIWKDEDDT